MQCPPGGPNDCFDPIIEWCGQQDSGELGVCDANHAGGCSDCTEFCVVYNAVHGFDDIHDAKMCMWGCCLEGLHAQNEVNVMDLGLDSKHLNVRNWAATDQLLLVIVFLLAIMILTNICKCTYSVCLKAKSNHRYQQQNDDEEPQKEEENLI